MNAGGWLFVLVLMFAATGCATFPALQYPQTPVVSRRIAAFPSEGVLSRWDFYGRSIDEPASRQAKRNLDDSITYRLRRFGGRSFDASSIEHLDHARAFRSWVVDTLTEIMEERLARYGPQQKLHTTVGDFRFQSSLESWRSALDADFVLVTLFLDGRNSAGRELAVSLGGGTLGAQRAIACAVHLQSGRCVWCKFDEAMRSDLLLRWSAQKEVDLLLGEMLAKGVTATGEPPPASSAAARIAPAPDVLPPPPPPPVQPGPEVPAPANFQSGPKPTNRGPS